MTRKLKKTPATRLIDLEYFVHRSVTLSTDQTNDSKIDARAVTSFLDKFRISAEVKCVLAYTIDPCNTQRIDFILAQ